MVESILGDVRGPDAVTEVYRELLRLQLEQGRASDAFSTAERLRARAYVEQLGGRRYLQYQNR